MKRYLIFSMAFVSVLLVVSSLVLVSCLKRPDYIKPCPIKNFQECALKRAQEAIPFVVEGDKTFKVMSFHPLKLSMINLNAGDSFTLNLTDVVVEGLEKMVPKDINYDKIKRDGYFKILIEKLKSTGKYIVDGMVSVLPIKGSGPFDITFQKVNINYYFSMKLVERKGKTYGEISNSSLTYDAESLSFKLENLFNGDKTLGAQINTFLNENWREMNKDLGPSISRTMMLVGDSIAGNYFSKIPYNDLFLD